MPSIGCVSVSSRAMSRDPADVCSPWISTTSTPPQTDLHSARSATAGGGGCAGLGHCRLDGVRHLAVKKVQKWSHEQRSRRRPFGAPPTFATVTRRTFHPAWPEEHTQPAVNASFQQRRATANRRLPMGDRATQTRLGGGRLCSRPHGPGQPNTSATPPSRLIPSKNLDAS